MYNITLPILGTRLKQIREHIGYSQAQLAEQLNCKQNAISNLELGKGGKPKTFISSAEFLF
ncbi:helix-turn-helix domain-containing protein [Phocaeicola vulgatus]|nr:helix-turn-helix domain-containing protein [Phocaeicola vulgatus]